MQIYININTIMLDFEFINNKITLDVEQDELIKDVKMKLIDKIPQLSIAYEKISLIFEGKKLLDENILSYYNINKENILHLLINNNINTKVLKVLKIQLKQ
jgi:hypothetical protein